MDTTVRKNITIESELYDTINNFARQRGMSFSRFLRESAIKEIRRAENLSLLEFLQDNCVFVSDDEQRDIAGLDIDFSDTNGKSIDINELLRD